MRYALPALIQLALLVYALIDCIQTDSTIVRNLSKPLWVFLIVVVPIAGPIAWLVAGRPERARPAGSTNPSRSPWPSTSTAGFPEYERPRPPRGPDDDPEFLARLHGPDKEKEELLRQWEEQLRRREQELRDGSAGSPEEPGRSASGEPEPPSDTRRDT